MPDEEREEDGIPDIDISNLTAEEIIEEDGILTQEILKKNREKNGTSGREPDSDDEDSDDEEREGGKRTRTKKKKNKNIKKQNKKHRLAVAGRQSALRRCWKKTRRCRKKNRTRSKHYKTVTNRTGARRRQSR